MKTWYKRSVSLWQCLVITPVCFQQKLVRRTLHIRQEHSSMMSHQMYYIRQVTTRAPHQPWIVIAITLCNTVDATSYYYTNHNTVFWSKMIFLFNSYVMLGVMLRRPKRHFRRIFFVLNICFPPERRVFSRKMTGKTSFWIRGIFFEKIWKIFLKWQPCHSPVMVFWMFRAI